MSLARCQSSNSPLDNCGTIFLGLGHCNGSGDTGTSFGIKYANAGSHCNYSIIVDLLCFPGDDRGCKVPMQGVQIGQRCGDSTRIHERNNKLLQQKEIPTPGNAEDRAVRAFVKKDRIACQTIIRLVRSGRQNKNHEHQKYFFSNRLP